MICKFCGNKVETNEFDSFFQNPEDMPCSPECAKAIRDGKKDELAEKRAEKELKARTLDYLGGLE